LSIGYEYAQSGATAAGGLTQTASLIRYGPSKAGFTALVDLIHARPSPTRQETTR
jgi:hypothetical protein